MPAIELGSTNLYNDANLIAYYKAEDLTDSKGTFTLQNNGTVPFVAGQFNNAFRTGTAAGVYVGTNNNLGIDGGSVTILFFSRLFGTPTDTNQVFLTALYSNTSDVQYDFLLDNQSNVLGISFNRQRIGVAGDGTRIVLDPGTSASHLYGLTYDGTTLRGFYDGTQVGSIALSGNGNNVGTHDFIIGAGRTGVTPANAWFDDYAVFNRALGTQEMLDHWNGVNVIGGFMTPNRGYW